MAQLFLPPANINDFARSTGKEAELRAAWNKKMKDNIEGLLEVKDDDGNLYYPRFYNPLGIPPGTAVAKKTVSWFGFPRIVESWLDLGNNSTQEEWSTGYHAAEILRKITPVIVKHLKNGVLKKTERDLWDYDLDNKIALFKYKNGQVDLASAFFVNERMQDEYLEWFVYKNELTGKVDKIAFTSEGPEYWDVLSSTDPELTVKLYQEYAASAAVEADIYWQEDIACPVIEYEQTTRRYSLKGFYKYYKANDYNPYNKWNTTHGIMHLIQRNNSLGAEIRLAADATKRYTSIDNGADTFRFDLCACAGYGAINRNSDPTIGLVVNTLALADHKVTIGNPIGLYIGDIQVDGIKDKEGVNHPRADLLKIERGDEDEFDPKILRFSINALPGRDYGLESYSLGGFKLDTGGAIAKQTAIVIYGEAIASTVDNPSSDCVGKGCVHPQKNSFRVVVDPATPCSAIDWSKVQAPFELPVAAEEALHVANFALTAESKMFLAEETFSGKVAPPVEEFAQFEEIDYDVTLKRV